MLIEKILGEYRPEVVETALQYCLTNELYSAVDFRDAVTHFSKGIKQVDNNIGSVNITDGGSANLPVLISTGRDLRG